MAKDGSARGGQRVGAGRKSKALSNKIADGRLNGAMVLPEPEDIEGSDVPPVKDYLKATQKNGKDLCAEDIYIETYNLLAVANSPRRYLPLHLCRGYLYRNL